MDEQDFDPRFMYTHMGDTKTLAALTNPNSKIPDEHKVLMTVGEWRAHCAYTSRLNELAGGCGDIWCQSDCPCFLDDETREANGIGNGG